ncbi:spore germination protein GerPE [Paenibacillus sp. UNC451MF]|uniref:spore germination protein GerPE n=1 Tax=Paenibacillus sp. UNC451MF TaxID=1449063 RepID=UPI00048D3F09|nr:spore germination protein GerPE [Paenibacillus sp. UNC451MF]
MDQRVSTVGYLKINTLGVATVLEIGDSDQLTPFNYTIAVQREKAIFIQNEFRFSDYSLFSRSLLVPIINENIYMSRVNETPNITVNKINMFLASSSSIFHIGSSDNLQAQSRIKHIRHLLKERPDMT